MRAAVKVRLSYGTTGLDIEVDPGRDYCRGAGVSPVRRPCRGPCCGRLCGTCGGSPLRERVRPGQRVAISVCDGTRPQPRHLMIPAILEELDGITRLEDVVILVATGTHRGNEAAEDCGGCSGTR